MSAINLIKRSLIVMVAMVGLLSSCQRYDRFFFVKNKGAIMPVKVSGKAASEKYIILLPGGPSGDGLIYSTVFPVFRKQIEPHYKMVYYDQRGAGNCQGVYDSSSLHLQQLGEDLDKLVRTIKSRDSTARVFLLGYSYGGTLGLHYLLEPEHQKHIDGFISIAGAFDRKQQAENQQKLTEFLLDKWVQDGAIDNYEAMKAGYDCGQAPDIAKCKMDSIATVQWVTDKFAEVQQYNRFKLSGKAALRLLRYTFFSPGNPIQSGIAEGQNGRYFQQEFNEQMLSGQVAEIRVPILLLNGRYDTNVPFFEAEAVYGNIGTPVHKKKMIILEASGHLPMITEPDQLAESVIAFVKEN
ncbi:alpha/beta fold hydrolase [Flavilitoribacter nigricans]|uniref:Serine aminopeptidase S33 domain-containing protein n=1 Tax=Flavilitoribacter nigricans (strain ATCC 23147 / DSM 23189 / NBRC 102662 / NCIMB 1420 / SS-2) TaxID=1122177 RepID=A0A2D0N249_FLAN2|nr:alpha/beta hydrolase [Flavilitoribacter nigricans]PHN02527.1 hypothetical protein CRP01_31620 [Flavilitoribacter nigricans DSM 23189 = NBRC 102662]